MENQGNKYLKRRSYLRELIDQGEHQHLDFKFAINDSKKIARSLSAFANTDGGTLLVGVKDNGAIAGVRSDEEYYMVEAAAQMYCKPEVSFTTKPWNAEGKTVLEVTVPPSDEMPHYAPDKDGTWKAFIRVDDQNLLANVVLLDVWKKQQQPEGIKIQYSEKEKILLQYIDENKTITLSKFTKIAYIPRHKAQQILADLIVLRIIDIVFTEKKVFYKISEFFDSEEYFREAKVERY